MKQVTFDRDNGELRVVTDFFAALQTVPILRLFDSVTTGTHVNPGDNLIVVQMPGRDDIILVAPPDCKGKINALGKWSEDFAIAPSKVLLYILPEA